jgi:hypothetical protein
VFETTEQQRWQYIFFIFTERMKYSMFKECNAKMKLTLQTCSCTVSNTPKIQLIVFEFSNYKKAFLRRSQSQGS